MAKELRRNLTAPERQLWSLLRDRRLKNLKFRRQTPIGPFIVDFYCAAYKLVIELDGESHAERGAYDLRRQDWFCENGYRVLRFSNDDVLTDEESVLLGILKACGRLPETSS